MLMAELIHERLQLTSTDDAIDTSHHIKSWTRKKKLLNRSGMNFSKSLIR
jgi:hypothetical protein